MMEWISTEQVKSEVSEGVVYTLNRLTEGRRIELRKLVFEPEGRKRELIRELEAKGLLSKHESGLSAEEAQRRLVEHESGLSEDQKIERDELSRHLERIQSDEIEPAYVRWGLASVEGLTIDHDPATPETLISHGPPELYNEIANMIRDRVEVSADDFLASKSPSTSEPAADGETSPTTAQTVNGKATTSPEIVASISQAQ